MMSRRPVCVSCECDLKPERNGVWVVETAGEERRPYKVWHADKVRCPVCGVEVVVGFAQNPTAVDGQEFGASEMLDDLLRSGREEEIVFTHEKWRQKECKIKCPKCGTSVPDVPEDATEEEKLCNRCYEFHEKWENPER